VRDIRGLKTLLKASAVIQERDKDGHRDRSRLNRSNGN
jgi:hypothetical protein